MSQRCAHCPLAAGRPCKGESLARFCQLVDPTHRSYTPRYVGLLDASPTPSLVTMAGSAIAAAGRVAAAAATGQPILVDEAEVARRQAICDSCEHWDADRMKCRKCGCGGLKIRLATERCPIGKWPANSPEPIG